MRLRRSNSARSSALLLLAAAAMLPGVLALVAAGLCAAPGSSVGLSMSEAAGAFSFGPMLGADRGLLAPASEAGQAPWIAVLPSPLDTEPAASSTLVGAPLVARPLRL